VRIDEIHRLTPNPHSGWSLPAAAGNPKSTIGPPAMLKILFRRICESLRHAFGRD
jgi:hypothetical protein